MTSGLESRLERLERQAAPQTVRFLWVNSAADVGTVRERYRAENPGDESELIVFQWREEREPVR